MGDGLERPAILDEVRGVDRRRIGGQQVQPGQLRAPEPLDREEATRVIESIEALAYGFEAGVRVAEQGGEVHEARLTGRRR